MIIRNLSRMKKVTGRMHGETALYQTLTQFISESMQSFSNLARITVPPRGTNRIHEHKDIEQLYFFMQGEGVAQVGDEKSDVKAGDVVFLPANIGHGFFNTGDKTAIIFLVGTRIYPE